MVGDNLAIGVHYSSNTENDFDDSVGDPDSSDSGGRYNSIILIKYICWVNTFFPQKCYITSSLQILIFYNDNFIFYLHIIYNYKCNNDHQHRLANNAI